VVNEELDGDPESDAACLAAEPLLAIACFAPLDHILAATLNTLRDPKYPTWATTYSFYPSSRGISISPISLHLSLGIAVGAPDSGSRPPEVLGNGITSRILPSGMPADYIIQANSALDAIILLILCPI